MGCVVRQRQCDVILVSVVAAEPGGSVLFVTDLCRVGMVDVCCIPNQNS